MPDEQRTEEEKNKSIAQVRRHIDNYKRAWDRIHTYGDKAFPALDVLEQIAEQEGDLPSLEDHPDEKEHAEATIKDLQRSLHSVDLGNQITELFRWQEREMRAVYQIQAECGHRGETDLVHAINSLIATAEAYAEKPYDRRLAKVIRQRQYRDTQSRAQRRRKEKEDQEWADYEATHGPLPPIPGPAFGPSSGAQRALAKARRSGGGHRAGLRYFGWQY